MTSRKHRSFTKCTWAEAEGFVAQLLTNLKRVCLSVFISISLLSLPYQPLALTLFSRLLHHPRHQIIFSSVWEERGERKNNNRLFDLNIHQQQPRKTKTKKKRHKHSDAWTRRKVEHALAQTPIYTYRQTNTQNNRTQSTAQPEVYFMQKYSKVCFTIQLNIKGWYIPLWSLTPQRTHPYTPTTPTPSIHLQHTEKVAECHC